jgi:hypothetical protein
MRSYYIHDGIIEKGPLNIDELQSQSLKKETPIWYDGLDKWTTAGEVAELKSIFTSTPPPLHTTPPSFSTSSSKNQSYSGIGNVKPENKKNLKFAFITIGIISVLGVMGWLVYQNKTQAEVLQDTSAQISDQQQKITDQEAETKRIETEQNQKNLDQLQHEADIQNEKDRVNAANTEKFMGYRNNWQNFITVNHEPYSVSGLGGISDLVITVNNTTDKAVDEVQVMVNYITSGGKVWQTETVSVTNIAPQGSKSVTAPSSNRGSSVTEEIISISAKSFHFCYPSGMGNNKNFDPYFCK